MAAQSAQAGARRVDQHTVDLAGQALRPVAATPIVTAVIKTGATGAVIK